MWGACTWALLRQCPCVPVAACTGPARCPSLNSRTLPATSNRPAAQVDSAPRRAEDSHELAQSRGCGATRAPRCPGSQGTACRSTRPPSEPPGRTTAKCKLHPHDPWNPAQVLSAASSINGSACGPQSGLCQRPGQRKQSVNATGLSSASGKKRSPDTRGDVGLENSMLSTTHRMAPQQGTYRTRARGGRRWPDFAPGSAN